ncbi:MAG: ABC transporter permease [Cyclobacteriaceae bacterium]
MRKTFTILVRQIWESFGFAWSALRMNLLRTVLSLLGVTIGIFAIIAVFTVVDSLEKSIKDSLDFLGSDNIAVEKWPYIFGGPYPWWKYFQRPNPDYSEYEFLLENVENMQGITIYAVRNGAPMKYGNNSTNGNNLVGVAFGHKDVYEIPLDEGRYFTRQEIESARNVAIIGYKVKEELFPFEQAIGKEIKVKGQDFYVIATLKEEGESFLGAPTNDDAVYVPYKSFTKLYYTGRFRGIGSSITVKGYPDDYDLLNLESELTGLMRKKRHLKPREEDDFALNRPEAISNFIGATFDALWLGGWVIGGFSILIGGFGIANIMFVSVKERTPIIGIQKSLGAKNYFILSQFLFESIFLSVLGGAIGIFLVFLLSFIDLGTLEIALSFKNVMIGLGVSAIVGILSGIIPASSAAKMDPVVAIRTQ